MEDYGTLLKEGDIANISAILIHVEEWLYDVTDVGMLNVAPFQLPQPTATVFGEIVNFPGYKRLLTLSTVDFIYKGL